MPIVTERFDMEEYAHVDGLLANFQGVFFFEVKSISIGVQFFFLPTAESVLPAFLLAPP